MPGLIDRLKSGEILISDGAMSTLLQGMGLHSGAYPEEWNVTNPEAVASVYRAYIDAGSDLICTNTCGGNPIKLDRYGVASRAEEFNAASVRLAKQEAGERVLVAASIGPTGHLLEPLGELPPEAAEAAFKIQADAVAAAGADAILFETFFDLTEIEAGIKAALPTGVPIICTMTFDANGRTVMGVDAATAARALIDLGANVIGSNCGIGPDAMLPVVEAMATTGAYIMVQPNAGLPKVVGGQTTYDVTPEQMAEYAKQFVDAGARIVGGCCGSTPEHIAAIAKAVRSA
ncbi:MAG: homocysteine S-methyltransferase family protein [Armatimonadota bacterium]|nr:homocysteine S-methyltransferase family protein [Armatimonadota bacterium]